MIKMKTAQGTERDVDQEQIVMVAGPARKDKLPGARVVGATPRSMKAALSAEEFVESLPNKEQFVKLSFARSGHNFWINAKAVHTVRPANESDLVSMPNAAAHITFGKGKHRFITTDAGTARTLINAAGGKV